MNASDGGLTEPLVLVPFLCPPALSRAHSPVLVPARSHSPDVRTHFRSFTLVCAHSCFGLHNIMVCSNLIWCFGRAIQCGKFALPF